MKRIDANQLKGKGGFTLVELIVVLILMSMLAAVAVPSYLGFVDDNQAKECAKNREMLAAYVDEIRVTDSDAGMNEAIIAHPEIACPSGGKYHAKGENNTVYCDHEGHDGETTVILKSASVVQADVDKVQTEAPQETDPTTPPAPENGGGGGSEPTETDPPEEPKLILSFTPDSTDKKTLDMEVETSYSLTANAVPSHCKNITYSWKLESGNAAHAEGSLNGETISIHADQAGTCMFSCRATAISDIDSKTVDSNTISVIVNVKEKPSLSIALDSVSPLYMKAETSSQMKVIPTSVRCEGIQYAWQVTSGNADAAQVAKSEDGTATITINQAGDYTVSCQATAISEADNTTPVLSNVVNIVVKAVSLDVSIDPISEMETGSTTQLTAKASRINCQVDNYNWWLENDGYDSSGNCIVKITDGQGTPTINIQAEQTAGSCLVHCEATAKSDDESLNLSDQATTTVTVKEKTVIATDDIILRGWDSSIINYPLNASDYGMPSGGVWKGSAPVEFNYNEIKVNDDYKGGKYPITYTVGDQEFNMNVSVVYPTWGLSMQGNSDQGMYLGDESEIYAELNPSFATVRNNVAWSVKNQEWDAVTNQWVDTDKAIVVLGATREQESNKKLNKYIMAHANSVGRSIITASVDDPYDVQASVVPPSVFQGNKRETSKTITVKYKKVTSVAYDVVVLQPGQSVNITDIMHLTPSVGVDTSNLPFNCWGYDNNVVEISDGVIKAKNLGSTKATIQINKPGSAIQDAYSVNSDCQIYVVEDSDKIATVAIDPVTVMVGETVETVKHPIPATASMDGVTIKYTPNGNITVSEDGIVTAGTSGGSAWVSTEILLDGKKIANGSFAVNILSNEVNVNGIKLAITSWNSLRDYLIHQNEDSVSDIFLQQKVYSTWNDGQINYVLRPNANLPWDESYSEKMSFAEYLAQHGDQFVQINMNDVKNCSWGGTQWLNLGTIVIRESDCYVYTGDAMNLDTTLCISWTEAEMKENGLVKIS